jgi:membrane-associated phospholipid phosphatase
VEFVDVAVLAGWVAAVVWMVWLGACLGRALATDRPLGGRPRLGVVWKAQSIRGRVLVVGLGCAVWFDVAQLAVVDAVEDRAGLSTADLPIIAWIVDHRSTALTAAAKLVSVAGGTVVMGALALLSVVWLVWRRRWPQAGAVTAAAVGAAVIVSVMKPVLDRARPPQIDQLVVETNASLPSGHALGSTVVLGILTIVGFQVVRRLVIKAALATIIIVVCTAIGLSRLYLGVHWPTDVLTGWLLGAAWLSVCVTALALSTLRVRAADLDQVAVSKS